MSQKLLLVSDFSLSNSITEDEESQKLKAAVFLNIALCHLKLNNSLEVKKAVSGKSVSSIHRTCNQRIGNFCNFRKCHFSVKPFWKSNRTM